MGNIFDEPLPNFSGSQSTEAELEGIAKVVTQWCKAYQIDYKAEMSTIWRVVYLITQMHYAWKADVNALECNLQVAREVATDRNLTLENNLIELQTKYELICSKHKQMAECLRLWIEATGNNLSEEEKTQRIMRATVRTMEIELPTYKEDLTKDWFKKDSFFKLSDPEPYN